MKQFSLPLGDSKREKMLWDPLQVWTDKRHWIWATLAFWIALIQAPSFAENFGLDRWHSRGKLPDVFQEWSSARSYFDGLPVYSDLAVAARRYVGRNVDGSGGVVLINAHPPTSVLLALPLAGLDFETAFLVWNLASLPMLASACGSSVVGWRSRSPPGRYFPQRCCYCCVLRSTIRSS